MRIINGRDYYDNFIQYGVDNNIILNRKIKKLWNDYPTTIWDERGNCLATS